MHMTRLKNHHGIGKENNITLKASHSIRMRKKNERNVYVYTIYNMCVYKSFTNGNQRP